MNTGGKRFVVCKENGDYTVRTQEEAYALEDVAITSCAEEESEEKQFKTITEPNYWIDAMVTKTEMETDISMDQFFAQKQAEYENI